MLLAASSPFLAVFSAFFFDDPAVAWAWVTALPVAHLLAAIVAFAMVASVL